MNFKTDFISGMPKDSLWSGVYGYRPDSHKDYFQFGEIFAVMKIECGVSDFNLERFAKILMQEVHEYYFDEENHKQKESPLDVLDDALWKMKARMEIVLSREEEVSKNGIDLEMAVAVITQKALYAAVIGESKMYIYRKENFVDVSEALVDTNMTHFVKSGSLEIEEDDRFILATSQAVKEIGHLLPVVSENLNIDPVSKIEDIPGASLIMFAEENLPWPEIIEEVETAPQNMQEKQLTESTDIPKQELSEGEAEAEAEIIIDAHKKETVDSEKPEDRISPSDELQDRAPGESSVSQLKGYLSGLAVKIKAKVPKKETASDVKRISTKIDEPFEEEKKMSGGGLSVTIKNAIATIQGAIRKALLRVKTHFKENQTTYVKIIQTVANFFARIFAGVKGLFEREIIGSSSRRFSNQRKRIRRNRIIFAVILLVLVYFLYTNITGSIEQNQNEDLIEARTETYDALQQELEQINTRALTTLDDQIILRDLRALEGKVKYETTEKGLSDKEIQRLDSLLADIQRAVDAILKIQSFTQPQVIADFGAQFADSSPTDLEYANGSLFVSDSGRNVIYRLGTQLQSLIEPHITGLTRPSSLVRNVAGDVIFYDASTTDSAIGVFNPDDPESDRRFPGLVLSTIGNIDEVAIYSGNDALYEVHNTNNQIFKRDKDGTEYYGGGVLYEPDAASNWKSSSEIGTAVDIAAPFEIYVLSSGKGLFRYLGGGENTISFETFNDLALEDFQKFVTASSLDVTAGFLAIGVPNDRKIMLFSIEDSPEKPLTLVKQFVYRGEGTVFTDLNEIVINEQERKLYVLDGTKILRLDF